MLVMYMVYDTSMATMRKITVEVPQEILNRAQKATGEGLTGTVRRGLELVAASRASQELRALRGKVRFTIDLQELRKDRD
jgi:hypothetical protein